MPTAIGAAAALIANDGSPGRTAPISATHIGSSTIPVMVVSSEVASELASLAQIRPGAACGSSSRSPRASCEAPT